MEENRVGVYEKKRENACDQEKDETMTFMNSVLSVKFASDGVFRGECVVARTTRCSETIDSKEDDFPPEASIRR